MENEKFIYYLQTIYDLYHIPMTYIHNGAIYRRFEPYALNSNKLEWAYMNNELKDKLSNLPSKKYAAYHIHPNMIFFGVVKKIGTLDEGVTLGPIASIDSHESEIREYLFKSGLNSADINRLISFFRDNKLLNLDQFRNLLCNINLVMNETILLPEQLVDLSDKVALEQKIKKKVLSDEKEFLSYYDMVYYDAAEYANKMAFAIRNGQTNTLIDLLNNSGKISFGNVFKPTFSIRDIRNLAVGAIYIAYYIAAESGIQFHLLDDTKSYYLARVESLTTFEDISAVIVRALIAFTEKVKDNTQNFTDNPMLNRIIQYIESNITQKLTAEAVASELHISVWYIFNTFKKDLNKTFSQFILEEKIKKAIHLLRYTDKPLIEISNYLSFSSQSYFQKSFKKIMGITPTNYRKQINK